MRMSFAAVGLVGSLLFGVARAELLPMYQVARSFALPAEWARKVDVEAKTADVRVLTGAAGLIECEFIVADTLLPPAIALVEEEGESEVKVLQPAAARHSDDEVWTVRVDPEIVACFVMTDTGDVDIGLSGGSETTLFAAADSGHVTIDLSEMASGTVEGMLLTNSGNLLLYAPADAEIWFGVEDDRELEVPGFVRDGEDWHHLPEGDVDLTVSLWSDVKSGAVRVVLTGE